MSTLCKRIAKLTLILELICKCTAIRHCRHPRIFFFERIADRSFLVSYLAMPEPEPGRHPEYRIRYLSSSPSRESPWNTCCSPPLPAPNPTATIPGNPVAVFALGSPRQGLDQQLCHLGTRHGFCLDARVLLGPNRGRRMRCDGCRPGLSVRLQSLRLLTAFTTTRTAFAWRISGLHILYTPHHKHIYPNQRCQASARRNFLQTCIIALLPYKTTCGRGRLSFLLYFYFSLDGSVRCR